MMCGETTERRYLVREEARLESGKGTTDHIHGHRVPILDTGWKVLGIHNVQVMAGVSRFHMPGSGTEVL
jgi:hypothetical protein